LKTLNTGSLKTEQLAKAETNEVRNVHALLEDREREKHQREVQNLKDLIEERGLEVTQYDDCDGDSDDGDSDGDDDSGGDSDGDGVRCTVRLSNYSMWLMQDQFITQGEGGKGDSAKREDKTQRG
jgi:uncharacterized protein YfkK (UPF0435 family)